VWLNQRWAGYYPGEHDRSGIKRNRDISVNRTKLVSERSKTHGEWLGESLSSSSVPLYSVVKLCETLQAEEIDYCHWKSNAAIDRSASGENDLDLLVSRADVQRFINILFKLGFKEADALHEDQLPGVLNFYGYDEISGQFVHVHAHFQLVLGQDFTKNYRLPIERAYLDSAVQADLFRLPSPEFEFVVFIIRMVLKHSTLDTILMRHGYLSASERRELEFLLSPVILEKSYALLEQHLPFIDRSLFKACVEALQPGCSLWKRVRVGQQLQNSLRSCARRPQIVDALLKLRRRLIQPILSRLHLRVSRKRMTSGGLMISILGGDGSGKTTVVNELYQKFSSEFDAIKVHMGKPRWSLITIIVRGIVKIGRSVGFYPFVKEGSEPSLDTTSPLFPGYPWLIREVCTARDRYLDYKRARRFATNGGLVICDRFPLRQIKIMDGPQVERVTLGMKSNSLIRFLARLEQHYYQQIMLPDLMIVLRADPEICVQRKTDETPDSVRSRSREIWDLNWCGTPAHVVDASRPKSEVLSEVLNLAWSHL
jgi:thymidylate kinase